MVAYPTALDTDVTLLPVRQAIGAESTTRLADADYVAQTVRALEARVGIGASTPSSAGAQLVTTAAGLTAWRTPVVASASVIGNSATIPSTNDVALLNPSGGVTGIIMAAGAYDGQRIVLVNQSAFSITFAAAGTSHVADGTAAVLVTLRAFILTYDLTGTLWYRS